MSYQFNLKCSDYSGAEPFRVEVLDSAINALILDAREAYRVYELMMIRRPGDVFNYLWVRLEEVPESVTYNATATRKKKFPYRPCPWPDDCLPLTEFDSFFHWFWDMGKESAAWCPARNGKTFLRWGDELFNKVRLAQHDLRASKDVLVMTEVEAIEHLEHRYDSDASPPFKLTPPDYISPTQPTRSPAYYAKLAELLKRNDVRMVSSAGDDDFQTLKHVCLEQRYRAISNGSDVHLALPFHLSSDGVTYLKCWKASHLCWEQGLGHADLFIDGNNARGLASMNDWPSGPRRLVFTHQTNIGEIEGFRREQGDGWLFFEDLRQNKDDAGRRPGSFEEYQDMQRRRSESEWC